MVETTICLEDELMEEARRFAAQTGRSLDALLADALNELLSRPSNAKRGSAESGANEDPGQGKEQKVLPSFSMGKLLPGVDINNNEKLRDFLDDLEPGKYTCY